MTDGQAILGVLALLYIMECMRWLRPTSVAFAASWSARYRVVTRDGCPGNRHGGFLFLNPLPPLGPVFVTQPWPILPAPTGMCLAAPPVFAGNGTSPADAATVAYSALASISIDGNQIKLGDRAVVTCQHPGAARDLGALIRSLRDVSEVDRASLITDALRRMFDANAVGEHVDLVVPSVRTLHGMCVLQIIALFIVCPLVSIRLGVNAALLPLAAAVMAVHSVVLLLCYRCHKRLHPHARGDRMTKLIVMALCPPMAIRAVDAVSIDVLASFHPLAAASRLCSDPDFRTLAGRQMRHLRYPLAAPEQDAATQAVIEWFREVELQVVSEFLESQHIRTEELLAAGEPTEAGSESYCPRCRSEYVVTQGECSSCPGIALEPFTKT